MHHFDLLNHPDVWQAMRRLLGPAAALHARLPA